ncbi:YggS family pyridoxal phosphate-dependent enzyme [Alkalibacillus aidingensis]|uniref:YggS family pyridoxal phosphate-dependent enzyme n=1 Tax=Alkalibacillus aidingensis TaxID=2747607 RepID=UPI00166012E8|nr:YggS family pyridoxal phosphate-dependent enzyme [Alkalibacillus aidingensis]
MSVKDNYESIKAEIEAACQKVGRDPSEIKVIAVTKYVSIDRAKEALASGVSHIGENRLEGFLEKYEAIGDQPNWHFIGTLQSRKVKDLIDYVDAIHSMDRKSLAKEINKRAKKPVDCFVQVNTSGEESKHGLAPEEVTSFVKLLANYPNVRVHGLMTMAPYTDDEKAIRLCFQKLRRLQQEVQSHNFSHAPCDHLSMGMSNDYPIAIEEGATHIRIGSSLVGNEVK